MTRVDRETRRPRATEQGRGPGATTKAGASQQGSATLFAVAVVGLLVLVAAALGVAGAMVNAHRVAQSAADLAALSAARAAAGGGGDPCGAAASVASANGARLEGCAVDGFEVRVRVTAEGPRWLGQTHDLDAEARAGPVALGG